MARDYRESEERRGAASQPQPRGTAAPAHVGVAAQVVDALPVGVAVCELRDGAVFPLFVSEAACAMYGCTRAEYDQGIAQGKPLFTLDDMASAVERLGGAASLSGDYDVQVRTRRIDGAPFDVRVQARVIPGACGMAEMYAVLSDVTEEVREQRKRAWQNERYRLLSELAHAISFDYDSESDTVLLYLDRTGKGMEEQVITHYLENLSANRAGVVHPGSLATVRGMFERVNAGEAGVEIEYRADYHGNGYQWYRANLFVVNDEGGAWHLVGLIESIQNERELRTRAERDSVTGLNNHAAAKSAITQALADARVRSASACAVLDIDDFKQVNDCYGHLAGDAVLQSVGALLRASFREDDVLGRVGGDEFVVFLKGIGLDAAIAKLEQVRLAVEDMRVKGVDRPVTASVGVYATRPCDATYRDVFLRADEALYDAKRKGKGRVVAYGEQEA